MRMLVACEFSGIVRDAFASRGWDAWSCDLLPSEKPGNHIQGDVLKVLNDGWDLMIAHPPCTFLTVAANKWMNPEYAARFPDRPEQRLKAIEFFMSLYSADVTMVCVENPVGIMSGRFRKPDQIIQPWMFGHPEKKATCLWLKGIPRLVPSHIVKDEMVRVPESKNQRLHHLPPGPNRWKERSRTFTGIAEAMAEQWTRAICSEVDSKEVGE